MACSAARKARCAAAAEPEDPIRAGRQCGLKIAGIAALVCWPCCRCWPRPRPTPGARHRRADRGPVRHQPAFHHGPGRHAFVRPCRLFRPWRLRRSAAGQVRRDCRCWARSLLAPLVAARRRAAVRLVRGAAVGRLSRDADARLRADRVVDRVPVGERDRRLERRRRHLADRAVRYPRHATIC